MSTADAYPYPPMATVSPTVAAAIEASAVWIMAFRPEQVRAILDGARPLPVMLALEHLTGLERSMWETLIVNRMAVILHADGLAPVSPAHYRKRVEADPSAVRRIRPMIEGVNDGREALAERPEPGSVEREQGN